MTSNGDQATKLPIVLIHGLWMTGLSWENWAQRYSALGHEVFAPSWPGLDIETAALRRHPDVIAKLSVTGILDHYEALIRSLGRPPIIMGHSFGGAFTQVLVDRGLGAAGVGIASGPVRGVRDLPLSTLRSAFSLLRNPLQRHRAVQFTPKQFNYAFTNHMSLAESEPYWQRYVVPGSREVLLTGANANLNPWTPLKVDFTRSERAPLLFIAGGHDHVVPASVNKHNAAKYANSGAVTDFIEYRARTHFTLGQHGWEEVADYALDWATSHARG
jgi:pimeloyl-ACP methyl ester carboxylesterase